MTIQCSAPGCDLPDMHTGPHYPPPDQTPAPRQLRAEKEEEAP